MRYELSQDSSPRNSQLRNSIWKIAEKNKNISFQSQWIQLFLQLFKDKSQFLYFVEQFQELQNLEEANTQNLANLQPSERKISFQQTNRQLLTMNMEEQINHPTFDNNTQELYGLSNQIFTLMDKQLSNIKQEAVQQLSIVRQDPKISYFQWSQIIQSLITTNPFLSEQNIYTQLLKFDNQDVPKPNIIAKILLMKDYHRIKLGKIPIQRNSMRNMQNRYKFGFKLYNILKNEGKIYYLDHYKLDINFLPEYKWVQKDNKAIYKQQDEYLSLYISLSNQGMLLYDIKYQDIDKNQRIDSFLLNICDEVKIERKYQEYIVSGESLIHSLRVFCRDKGLKLLQLPPLSPQCSPLYYIFQDLKFLIRSKRQNLKNLQQLKDLIEFFCSKIRPQDYCSNISRSIIDALMKKMS